MFPSERTEEKAVPAPAAGPEDFIPAAGMFPAVEIIGSASREQAERAAGQACASFGMELLGMRQGASAALINIMPLPGITPPPDEEADGLFSRMCSCAAEIAAGLLGGPGIKTLSCFFLKRRAEKESDGPDEIMAKIIVSKGAEPVDYGGLRERVSRDYNELLRAADEYYIHPELKAGLRGFKY